LRNNSELQLNEDQRRKLEELASKPPEEALAELLKLLLSGMFEGQNLEQIFGNLDGMMGGGLSAAAGSGGYDYPGSGSVYNGSSSAGQSEFVGSGIQVSAEELAQFNSIEGNTLKNPSGAREAIKREYTARLDPYLYQGKLSDIPAGTKVVVLDLGHLANGSDLGASTRINGGLLCEAGACMETNIAMAKYFHENGVVVLSTSQSPRFASNTLSPGARGDFVEGIANQVGKDNVIAFFTHYNDGGNAKGVAMYLDQNADPRIKSMSADIIDNITAQTSLNTMFGKGVISETQTQHGSIGYLRSSYHGILPEVGFQRTNTGTLISKEQMQKIGAVIADVAIQSANMQLGWNIGVKEPEQNIQQATDAAPTTPSTPNLPTPQEALRFYGPQGKVITEPAQPAPPINDDFTSTLGDEEKKLHASLSNSSVALKAAEAFRKSGTATESNKPATESSRDAAVTNLAENKVQLAAPATTSEGKPVTPTSDVNNKSAVNAPSAGVALA